MNIDALFRKYEQYPDFVGVKITGANQQSAVDDTMLHIAARNAAVGDMVLLRDNGADVDMQGDLGYTALHYACMKGHPDAVRLLLTHKARKTVRNEFGETPADVNRQASHRFRKEIAALLK